MWIFPDNARRLCITTAGKQVMKIVGHQHSEAKTREANKGSSALEMPDKVIKVAVILAFGALVFLTRQKEPRKKNREGNDNLLSIPDYIDERSLKPWPRQQ
ncbi:UNVERIFIED_CONTAM: hypothetical protein Slati_2865000 [Sesamum latifolium]|uniref:Uncharacterized protein n=1 Tax=Sesamum latifolium TaxID=2727402 RepID=A0AAW2VFH8_9LAMI